jgi:serine/threonine protein phosphatase PrpC/sugar lactone lactonase YvrE
MPFAGRNWRHASCSTAGRRAINEDRVATLRLDRKTYVAAVADGVGGAVAGAVASEAAVRAFVESIRSATMDDPPGALEKAFAAADEAVCEAAIAGREGMGTTLVGAIMRGSEVWVGNVGDSRAVLVTKDEVVPLSREHTMIAEALRQGKITELEALRSNERHVISRALGDGDGSPEIEHYSFENDGVPASAVLVAGSDGLFNFVGDAEILGIASLQRRASTIAEQLVRRAVENGSDDNVSAAAVMLRRQSPFKRWIALAVMVAACASAALAQSVRSTSGEGAVLSVGAEAGVRKGMTGKLCAPELVGGRIVRNCSARFLIVSVSDNESVARITKGVESDVHAGTLAEFDDKLHRPNREVRKPPKKHEVTQREAANAAFQEANRTFRDGDFRGALERYENFLRRFPDDDHADEAKSRAEECRVKVAVAVATVAPPTPVSPPPRVVPPALLQAEQLASNAEKQFAAGQFVAARAAAIQALKADPTNPRALSILSAIRTKTVQSRFNGPIDVSVTSSGDCYVADAANNVIRHVAGNVTTTIAGMAGEYGTSDGLRERARFNDPTGVAVAGDGSLFVVDRLNATIRRIAPDGMVTTIAGRAGLLGSADGSGSAARFNAPQRIAIGPGGTLYVSDTGNHAIRRITSAGVVDTVVSASGGDRFDPVGLVAQGDGTILFADSWSHVIRKVDSTGRMTVLAGIVGSSGSNDGPAGSARFNAPEGIAADRDGNLYVADTGSHTIRKIEKGIVSTVIGRAGSGDAVDGTITTARLKGPSAVACDAGPHMWVADTANHIVRFLSDGFLETVGGLAGTPGSADGAN